MISYWQLFLDTFFLIWSFPLIKAHPKFPHRTRLNSQHYTNTHSHQIQCELSSAQNNEYSKIKKDRIMTLSYYWKTTNKKVYIFLETYFDNYTHYTTLNRKCKTKRLNVHQIKAITHHWGKERARLGEELLQPKLWHLQSNTLENLFWFFKTFFFVSSSIEILWSTRVLID